MFSAIAGSRAVAVPLVVAVAFLLAGFGLVVLSRELDRGRRYVVLALAVGVSVTLCISFYKFTIDDAYISLRYARNLANGYGLVFSTDGSSPVEGYTNFLWVLLEAPLYLLKLSDSVILHCIKIAGIAFSVGAILLVYRMTRLFTQDTRAGLFACLFLAAIPQLSFWAIGGLETTMYIFWLMAGSYFYIVEERNKRVHLLSMLFLTLAAFTRWEGVLVVLAFIALVVITRVWNRDKGSRLWGLGKLLPGIVVFALLYGAYFVWRYGFYRYLFPNTVYARGGAGGVQQVWNRITEMGPFIFYLLPVIALAWFAYFHLLRQREGVTQQKQLLGVVLLVLVALGLGSKREWMPGFRYELPWVPILMLLFSVSICEIVGAHNKPTLVNSIPTYVARMGLLLCLGVFLLYPAIDLHQSVKYTDHLDRAHVTLGKWLREYAPSDASYAGWDMGAVPYYSELPSIIEIHPEGILSTYITHTGYNVNYFLSLNPSFIVLPSPSDAESASGGFGFYANHNFRDNYELILSFAFQKDYILCVHKRKDVQVSPAALEEGCRLADLSWQEAQVD